jgi:iron complex outermembrane receptor protein
VNWKLKTIYFLFFLFSTFLLPAQNSGQLTGIVTDDYNHPLIGASVQLDTEDYGTTTNRKGVFSLTNLKQGRHIIKVSFLGYKTHIDTFVINGDINMNIRLMTASKLLNEVEVNEKLRNSRKKENSMSVEMVDKAFLAENMGGSLMQTLSRLPGISSMDIGSGQSKPVIRGLGFNRVAVAENGVKHEAQEWGADHGLEIDQFNVERIEVIKGPASLMYGANAIGGIIDLKQIATPAKHSQGGNVLLSTQTNNNLYGGSAKYFVRKDKFYFKTHFSMSDYADYKVPTDSIEYMSYYFKLKNKRLRNTAGKEQSGGLILGYLNNGFSSHLSVTDVFSKSGFFANAHGLEIRNSDIDYDGSMRDIDLPMQQVNHLKILSNNIWMIQDYRLNVDLAFQNNYRKEFSEAVSHGYMPAPPDSLERLYNKNTWTGNVRFVFPKHGISNFTTGINTEYQQNKIDGWGFILPAYQSFTSGIFLHNKIRFSERWMLNAGLRYDIGTIKTDAYYDWYATPQGNGSAINKQRAANLNRTFNSVSWGVGATYSETNFMLKINAGKSFRMPTAKELASNGINYHMYRYEKGDTTLRAEESYQLDMGLGWSFRKLNIEISPFVNYFPNYIYLNPTSDYYEAQQVYYHSESEVFRTGGECVVSYDITNRLSASVDAEYVYSVQLSGAKKGFTLPFSPPFVSNFGLKYAFKNKGIFQKPNVGFDFKLVAAQNNIVPPEKKTPGYGLINMTAGTGIKMGNQIFQLNAQVHNLLNAKYFDHASFYRLIQVPGQGRNVVINLQLPF